MRRTLAQAVALLAATLGESRYTKPKGIGSRFYSTQQWQHRKRRHQIARASRQLNRRRAA